MIFSAVLHTSVLYIIHLDFHNNFFRKIFAVLCLVCVRALQLTSFLKMVEQTSITTGDLMVAVCDKSSRRS